MSKLPRGTRPTLVIMAKRPEAGRVKTRLASDIGTVEALRFYRSQLRATCRRLREDKRWHTVLALTPDLKGARFPLPVQTIIGQGRGDLGVRMQRLFDRFNKAHVVIIGADIPGIAPAMIARAFQSLAGHDMVFGPAQDGGYWLIGQRLKRRPLRPFGLVRWSSPHALADTLGNLEGRRVGFVDLLRDVDTGKDFAEVGKSVVHIG